MQRHRLSLTKSVCFSHKDVSRNVVGSVIKQLRKVSKAISVIENYISQLRIKKILKGALNKDTKRTGLVNQTGPLSRYFYILGNPICYTVTCHLYTG